MKRIESYKVEFVTAFGSGLAPGVLYVSTEYSTAAHLCPCGCEQRVVTKLSPARWRVIFDGEVSLKPSVASTGMDCNSHYFITRGAVEWCDELGPNETARARKRDLDAIAEARQAAPARGWRQRLSRLHRRG